MDNADQFVKQVLKAIPYFIFVYPFVLLKRKVRKANQSDCDSNDKTAEKKASS